MPEAMRSIEAVNEPEFEVLCHLTGIDDDA